MCIQKREFEGEMAAGKQGGNNPSFVKLAIVGKETGFKEQFWILDFICHLCLTIKFLEKLLSFQFTDLPSLKWK